MDALKNKVGASAPMYRDAKWGPTYAHTCSCCQFLGQYQEGGTTLDLYAHKGLHKTTYIARWGDECEAHFTGTASAYGASAFMTEARRRARMGGWDGFDMLDALLHGVQDFPGIAEEIRQALPYTVYGQAIQAFMAGATHHAARLVQKAMDELQKQFFPTLLPHKARCLTLLQAEEVFTTLYRYLRPTASEDDTYQQVSRMLMLIPLTDAPQTGM